MRAGFMAGSALSTVPCLPLLCNHVDACRDLYDAGSPASAGRVGFLPNCPGIVMDKLIKLERTCVREIQIAM